MQRKLTQKLSEAMRAEPGENDDLSQSHPDSNREFRQHHHHHRHRNRNESHSPRGSNTNRRNSDSNGRNESQSPRGSNTNSRGRNESQSPRGSKTSNRKTKDAVSRSSRRSERIRERETETILPTQRSRTSRLQALESLERLEGEDYVEKEFGHDLLEAVFKDSDRGSQHDLPILSDSQQPILELELEYRNSRSRLGAFLPGALDVPEYIRSKSSPRGSTTTSKRKTSDAVSRSRERDMIASGSIPSTRARSPSPSRRLQALENHDDEEQIEKEFGHELLEAVFKDSDRGSQHDLPSLTDSQQPIAEFQNSRSEAFDVPPDYTRSKSKSPRGSRTSNRKTSDTASKSSRTRRSEQMREQETPSPRVSRRLQALESQDQDDQEIRERDSIPPPPIPSRRSKSRSASPNRSRSRRLQALENHEEENNPEKEFDHELLEAVAVFKESDRGSQDDLPLRVDSLQEQPILESQNNSLEFLPGALDAPDYNQSNTSTNKSPRGSRTSNRKLSDTLPRSPRRSEQIQIREIRERENIPSPRVSRRLEALENRETPSPRTSRRLQQLQLESQNDNLNNSEKELMRESLEAVYKDRGSQHDLPLRIDSLEQPQQPFLGFQNSQMEFLPIAMPIQSGLNMNVPQQYILSRSATPSLSSSKKSLRASPRVSGGFIMRGPPPTASEEGIESPFSPSPYGDENGNYSAEGSKTRVLGTDTNKRTTSLAYAIMTLALLSASASQLRFIVAYSKAHSYAVLSYFLISVCIIIEIVVGVGYVVISRFNLKESRADAIQSYFIAGLFIVTICNVIIAAFAFDDHVCEVLAKETEMLDVVDQSAS